MPTPSRKSAHPLSWTATLVLVLGGSSQLFSHSVSAQSPQPITTAVHTEAPKYPVFDVISVRKAQNPQVLGGRPLGDGYAMEGMSIRWLMMQAYSIPTYQSIVGEPDWTRDLRYDIQAKVGGSDVAALQKLEWKQRYAMLQQILTERFKLKAHWETRSLPAYSLIVIKKGLLHESAPPVDGKAPLGLGIRPHGGVYTTEGTATMAQLAHDLGASVGRVGVDNTGLSGRYDIKFDWVREGTEDLTATDTGVPSLFTAIQEQLGLKLVTTTAPVECFIIDHIEPPAEN